MIMQHRRGGEKGVVMTGIPAVREPSSIAPFFKALARTPVPVQVDAGFMADIGFRRQTDVRLLELLHHLGFMDNSLRPTSLWKDYANALDEEKRLAVLGSAVAEKYSDALRIGGTDGVSPLNGKAVMAFFKGETGAGDTEAAYMVLTLQILVDMARLPENLPSPVRGRTCPVPGPESGDTPAPSEEKPLTLTLHITLDPVRNPELADLVRRVLEDAARR
jgi:hypothetical protein